MLPNQPNVQESRTQAIFFSKADFEEFDPLNCRPYFLSDRQVALIVSCLRYADWEARWEDRDNDEALVESTYDELMNSCDELREIRLQITRIANALYQSPSASDVIEAETEGHIDNQETSVGTTLFNATVEQQEQDYTDELLEIVEQVGIVAALL